MLRMTKLTVVAICLLSWGERRRCEAQQPSRTLEPNGNASVLSFSPKGDLLAVASGGTVRLWDTNRWRVARKIEHPEDVLVSALAFSPDGKLLATGPYAPKEKSASYSEAIRLWDVGVGKLVKEIPIRLDRNRQFQDFVPAVRFSPDGKELAFIERLSIRFYDVSVVSPDKPLSRTRASIFLPLESEYLCDVAYSPDGKWCAVGDRSSLLRLWNLADDPRKLPLPSGRAASTAEQKAKLKQEQHEALRRKPRELYRGAGGELWSVAFTPDSAQLVVADFFTIRVVDLKSGEARTLGKHKTNDVRKVVVSPDGKYVASAGGGGVRLWKLSDNKLVREFMSKRDEYAVDFSPDGKWLALETDGKTQIWELSKLCPPE